MNSTMSGPVEPAWPRTVIWGPSIDGSPLACTACHVQLAAVSIVDLPTPPKATCAGCHDGKHTFKLTGTTCRKCHVNGAS